MSVNEQLSAYLTTYLNRSAEAESTRVRSLPIKNHQRGLVIPCFSENWETVQKVWQALDLSWLLILVVNSPPETTQAAKNTKALLSDIRKDSRLMGQNNNTEIREMGARQLLVIDRCTGDRVIDSKEGVGLARKTGADVCLALIDQGKVRQAIIYTSDADAILPRTYGLPPGQDILDKSIAAFIYPFVHEAEPHLRTAALLYEIHLFSYVLGLYRAGSSYAFHTLGSTLAISATHYAKVRGFPKKNAGEDFYLLNKLAKTGSILQLSESSIRLQARVSSRVPFGTGPAVQRIFNLSQPLDEYLFYHPQTYEMLKSLMQTMPLLYDKDLSSALPSNLPSLYREVILSWACANSFDTIVAKGRENSRSRKVFLKFLQDWFDALRTLRFVHHARDHGLASLTLKEYLHLNPDLAGHDVLPDESNLHIIRENMASRHREVLCI